MNQRDSAYSQTELSLMPCSKLLPDSSFLLMMTAPNSTMVELIDSDRKAKKQIFTMPQDWNGNHNLGAISPDGKLICISDLQGRITLWNREDQKLLHFWRAHQSMIWDMEFSHDSQSLMTSTPATRLVEIWDVATAKRKHTIQGVQSPSRDLKLSKNNELFAWCGDQGNIQIYHLQQNKILHTIKSTHTELTVVAIAPDNSLIATGSGDGYLELWNATTGERIHEKHVGVNPIVAIDFHPSGTRLAVGTSHTVKIFEIDQFAEMLSLRTQQKLLRSMTFNGDGSQLKTVFYNGTMIVWNTKTRSP